MITWDFSRLGTRIPTATRKNISGVPNCWRSRRLWLFKTPAFLRGLISTTSELEKRLADLREAETALARSEGDRQVSEEKFQKVFRSSPIPFSITTVKEGRFLDVNAAFERRYGYSRQEVLGHTVHELKMWEDPADRILMIEQLQRGGPIRNVITRLRTKSGEIKLTAYSADRIQFDGQSCILAVSEDLPDYDQRKVN